MGDYLQVSITSNFAEQMLTSFSFSYLHDQAFWSRTFVTGNFVPVLLKNTCKLSDTSWIFKASTHNSARNIQPQKSQ